MITTKDDSFSIPVLAVGKGWIAVEKPAGMTVHNEPGGDLCSFVSAFIETEPGIRDQMQLAPGFGVHPVHRLDKETSGVMLVAADKEAFRLLSLQFESGRVTKQYFAILHGLLESPKGPEPWGNWRMPLGKEAGGRHNPHGGGKRQPSQTRYRVVAHSTHYTMVELELLTGRKHQIRRHAKLAGHPVAGDARYGSTRAVNFLKKTFAFDRIALHARRLTLTPPDEKKTITIETSAIPKQMEVLFEKDKTDRKA
jgi:RluA family pseudouridine synthase